jgi:hypothetical protein
MRTAILAAFAALMLSALPAAAQAGTWNMHWTGPNGGVYEGSGQCANGVCQSSGTFKGPYGGVWHHSGNAHQVAPGQWVGEGRLIGPAGGTWQNSWTWRRAGN